ncbi:hypothetical protein [Avibacterium paragallinarum]|uniref:hypothetical protein n=1 Tax=Avibacterium paragallinarum TaxID=728 RepID=UPI00397D21CF
MTHDKLFDTKSHIKEKMRGQNVGVEVGMFAQAGPQTGVGVYATVGGGSQKNGRGTHHLPQQPFRQRANNLQYTEQFNPARGNRQSEPY